MIADAQFKDFVARQQRHAYADEAVDWHKERDEWLDYLGQLYMLIAEYLSEYIASGSIKLRETEIELNEENIGVYNARRMAIIIGSQEVRLTPIGTLLIGSKGRVDVEGSAGGSRLVLIDKIISHPRQMFRATVRTILPESSPPPLTEPPPYADMIEWTWKIASRPPAMQFVELNKESLFEMLMEVSNG